MSLQLSTNQPSLPKVTVITIVLNDPVGVHKTINSVLQQTYSNLEYVLIDGNSTEETQRVLAEFQHAFSHFVSEPDQGIYDAMNKGLKLASGEWYIMMNAGDVFCDEHVVRDCIEEILKHPHITWAGGCSRVHINGNIKMRCANHQLGIYHHQSVFIQRRLHEKYGFYISDRGCNAWDYFLFNLLRNEPFLEIKRIVADCDGTGISTSSVKNYLQVTAIAFIFGRQSRFETGIKLLLYPWYRQLRSLFTRSK